MAKHVWDNVYVIIAGFILLLVILLIPMIDLSNELVITDYASLPITGNYYEPGSGIRGFMTGVDENYAIVLGNTVVAKEQVRINELAGVYRITDSRFLSENDFSNIRDILIIAKQDSSESILDSTKLLRINSAEEALVILDENKRQLVLMGGSSDALIYAIGLLKTLDCNEFDNLIVITKIGAGCQLYTRSVQSPSVSYGGGGGAITPSKKSEISTNDSVNIIENKTSNIIGVVNPH
ncbi:MAG: hypothetical protein V1870_03115, partial [Candidatus Aenigmatarchaeota archaeon]